MQVARSVLIVLAVLGVCGARAAVARGQEPGDEEDRTEKLKQDLRRIDATFKPGDEVIALSDADLTVEAKSVGSLRKGGKCTVERVQDNWLWVRSGDIRGWIDRGAVIGAALMDWYKRLPDNSSIEHSGVSRAKYEGILFEIADAGERGSVITGRDNAFLNAAYNGVPVPLRPPFTATTYSNLGIIIHVQGKHRELGLYLTAGQPLAGFFSGVFEAALRARSYGTVEQGDYAFIDPRARLVLVNGERRRLQ